MMRNLGAAERSIVRGAAIGISHFGGDLKSGPRSSRLLRQPLTQNHFTGAATIGIGGVEPGKTQIAYRIQHGQRPVAIIALVAVFRRRTQTAEIAAAEYNSVSFIRLDHRYSLKDAFSARNGAGQN